jgi:phage gp45-like
MRLEPRRGRLPSVNEATAIQNLQLVRGCAAEVEQVLRDVAEHHGARAALEGAETDEPFAAADV